MIFRILNQPKKKLTFRIITYLLLSCFIITMSGCVTTRTYKYSKEKLIQKNISENVSYIVLKNGTKIDTKDKKVSYADSIKSLIITGYDSVESVKKIKLVLTDVPGVYDTIVTGKENTVKPSGKKTVIPLTDLLEVFVEKSETNTALTTLFIVGVIAGVALSTILIKNWTEPTPPPPPPTPPQPPPPPPPPGSCPLVYSFDGEKYVFDCEPISGVISKGLTRTDYSKMEFLNLSDNKFKLLVKNQPNEKEMLDELKLISVSHDENTFVTPNPEGEFFNYKTIIKPESVTDENGNDVRVFFNEKDNIRWQTQMLFDTSFKGRTEKHKLKFRFPKPENARNALLFVNCGTAYWGSYMIRNFLQLKGDKIDKWYKDLYWGSEELLKLFVFLGREELFTMNVNLLEGDQYVSKTLIPAGGPLMDEDRIIRLPLKNVTGNFVEFIINPPPGFWKIDQIGIIYDYEITGKDKIKELNAVYATNQDGTSIVSEIQKADKNYYIMPGEGDYSNIYFDAPPDFDKKQNEIFLKTTGYYELGTDKNKSEQTELLEELMTTPGKIIEYSMELYKQDVKRISESLIYKGKK